ncbi:MAG: T9SS type A sorting domain-containing protein [Chitinophagales bacterium]|nr:T9SS type A sorting domain-containing protein [Chitinophagales bacterium]
MSENSRLLISNVLGVLFDDKILSNGAGKLILNTTNYQNGIYLARIETEGTLLLKSKFIISK